MVHRKSYIIRPFLVAAISSLLLIIASYFYNNLPLFTGEKLPGLALAEWVRHHFHNDSEANEVLYINVAYDRELTTYYEEGIPLGNTDITDRTKLLHLLQLLDSTNYRYLFMDIRFETGCASANPAVDSMLFAQIADMPHIVVAQHSDLANMQGAPTDKMALNDYYSTITATNFVRYQFLHHDQPSMPLFAYEELTGQNITRHGIAYTSAHRLCYNSLFLHFPPEDPQTTYINQMGKDILESDEPLENLRQMADGKIVVIGDFIHDLHDTYSGMHAGSKMLAIATLALLNRQHLVNIGLTIFLFFLYFVMMLVAYTPKRWYEYIPFLRNIRFPLLTFALSFIGFSAVFFIISFTLDLFHLNVSFLLPSLWLSIFSSYIAYKRSDKMPK